MTANHKPTDAGQDEQLQLLRRVDTKLDHLDGKLDRVRQEVRRDAAVYGAAAGGIAGGIISVGLALARAKLGL